MSETATIELFDLPAMWRAGAARALGYDGLDLAAAVAPGAGFPAVLSALSVHLAVERGDLVVDVGAGLGGASAWIAALTGVQVVAVEPAAGSRHAAAELFPQLLVHDGRADELPVADGAADAVTAIGVCSLLDDLSCFFDEAVRVLRPGGGVGIADLFLLDGPPRQIGPNTFRSVPDVADELTQRGFAVIDIGCGSPEPSAAWRAINAAVEAEITRMHRLDPEYAEWKADQDHLAALFAAGTVMSGCVVARQRPRS